MKVYKIEKDSHTFSKSAQPMDNYIFSYDLSLSMWSCRLVLKAKDVNFLSPFCIQIWHFLHRSGIFSSLTVFREDKETNKENYVVYPMEKEWK